MNWKITLHAAIAAAIGGAIPSLSAAFLDPAGFNFTSAGLSHLGKLALAGALSGIGLWLKQSPIPPATPAPASTDTLDDRYNKLLKDKGE